MITSEAELVVWALENGWKVIKNKPLDFLTDEANQMSAWSAMRDEVPYSDSKGNRMFSGSTATAAITKGINAIGFPMPLVSYQQESERVQKMHSILEAMTDGEMPGSVALTCLDYLYGKIDSEEFSSIIFNARSF